MSLPSCNLPRARLAGTISKPTPPPRAEESTTSPRRPTANTARPRTRTNSSVPWQSVTALAGEITGSDSRISCLIFSWLYFCIILLELERDLGGVWRRDFHRSWRFLRRMRKRRIKGLRRRRRLRIRGRRSCLD